MFKQVFDFVLMADADDQRIGQFAFEDFHQRQCGFVVELVGGFVEEQDLRFVQQCAGKAEPLLPSSNTHSGAQALRVIPESSLPPLWVWTVRSCRMKMPPVLLPDGDGSGFCIAAAGGQGFFERIAAYGVSDGIFTEQAVRIHRWFCGNFGYGGGRCYNNGLFLKGGIMEATVYLEDNEYIALCDLLKLAGLAESGGQAKAFIAEGLVLRNGETEIRGGEVIEFDGARLEIADGYDPEE